MHGSDESDESSVFMFEVKDRAEEEWSGIPLGRDATDGDEWEGIGEQNEAIETSVALVSSMPFLDQL